MAFSYAARIAMVLCVCSASRPFTSLRSAVAPIKIQTALPISYRTQVLLKLTRYRGGQTQEEKGLTDDEVRVLQKSYGKNILEVEYVPDSYLRKVLHQFGDRLSQMLVAVAVISACGALYDFNLHAIVEPAMIVLVLLLNAGIGAWQVIPSSNTHVYQLDGYCRPILPNRPCCR
jgi:magnesium-transporting ATPase (P-type)